MSIVKKLGSWNQSDLFNDFVECDVSDLSLVKSRHNEANCVNWKPLDGSTIGPTIIKSYTVCCKFSVFCDQQVCGGKFFFNYVRKKLLLDTLIYERLESLPAVKTTGYCVEISLLSYPS